MKVACDLLAVYPDEAPCLDEHQMEPDPFRPDDSDSAWWAMQAGYADEQVPDEVELNTVSAWDWDYLNLDPEA